MPRPSVTTQSGYDSPAGEGDPLAGVADLAEPGEGVALGVLGLQQDEQAGVVQRVDRDPAHSAGRGLGVGRQDQPLPVPRRLAGEGAGRAVGEGRLEDERPGALPGRSTPALRYLPVLTVISSPAESLVSFQAQSADSLQNPRARPRWTCPTPRHDPTSGAYAFSASWSARRPGATLSLSSTARTMTAAAATTPSAANRPTPDETLALRIVDSSP